MTFRDGSRERKEERERRYAHIIDVTFRAEDASRIFNLSLQHVAILNPQFRTMNRLKAGYYLLVRRNVARHPMSNITNSTNSRHFYDPGQL